MADSPYSANVTQDTFDSAVLERSREIPVLVDFWAAWCGPCQMLMPRLAQLADTYAGQFFLAKVNTDEEQALANRYGIRSLPTVKLFKNGEVVDEFMGVQPDSAIRALLDRHIPRPSDKAAAAAIAAYRAGDAKGALTALETIVADAPANDRARLLLAEILFDLGRVDEGESTLKGISAKALADPDTAAAMGKLEFARVAAGAPPLADLERGVAAHGDDLEARYQLAARQVLARDYEAAMAQLLEIVRRDRRFRDDAGRKGLLAVFNLLGGKGEAVKRYRQLLSLAMH